MRKVLSVGWLVGLVTFLSSTAYSESDSRSADQLFKEALAADQIGDAAQRDSLLAEVLLQEPGHKLARWYSGQVMHAGNWRNLDAAEKAVSSNSSWQDYRERVESSSNTLGDHAELARWCGEHGLQPQEQWHWFNVLRHEPGNREALGRLGVRLYQGGYHTPEQIAANEAFEKQAKKDFERHSKYLKAAMRSAERTEGSERANAIDQIASISDPAAIEPIVSLVLADAKNERRILSKMGTARGEVFLRAMQLAAVKGLSNIPEHESTLRLLEVSLYASDSKIRQQAAIMLRHREPTSYMPILMAGLAAPIELEFTVSTLPNGQITVFEDYSEAGPLSEKRHTRTSTFLTQHVNYHTHDNTVLDNSGRRSTTRSTSVSGLWSDQRRDMANAAAQVSNSQSEVELENELRKERNSRIECVLEAASGKELGEEPQAWWSDWKTYNEIYVPEETPVEYTEENHDYTVVNETRSYSQFSPPVEVAPAVGCECFQAGTPVWTQAGPVRIEELRPGDFVLSQNPHTGELSYRPIIQTTTTPETELLKMSVGKEEIVSTGGHRFWRSGTGWRMAKQLYAGDAVFSTRGSVDIQKIEKTQPSMAYNLEVAEFHTYFVGTNRLLVHDYTCPEPTINKMPGISPRTESVSQLAARN
jgi:hypothetical protein